jgi:L-alanine-DL-glutamate epimerase-like enolase superfamily enzyme
MAFNRRKFIEKGFLLSAFTLLPMPLLAREKDSFSDFSDLNLGLHQKIKQPVIIKSIELLEFDKELIIKATSTDGVSGITFGNLRMEYLKPIIHGLVIPFFIGKDARDLVNLIDGVYRDGRNYKYSGMPFSNCVGHVELALWDLLGNTANQPVYQILGKQLRSEIPVYLSSLTRETTPEEEAERLGKRLEETGAQAIKIKVGGRMSNNEDSKPGRTRNLLPVIRKRLGDKITIYADANGSYDVKNGIEVGKMLEDYGVAIFEEPCPFEDYESNQKINKALKKLKLAGGEQDTSLYRFKDIIKNNVYDVVQPDLYYNGGIIRCLQVAQMAAQSGKTIAPHSPKTDPLAAPMLHFASVVPNLEGYQEWEGFNNKQKSWWGRHFQMIDGKVKVPEGSGLGVIYDEQIWSKATNVK